VFSINALGFLIVVAAIAAWRTPPRQQVAGHPGTDLAQLATSDLGKIPSAVKAVWIRSVLFSIPVAAVPALIPVLCLKEICTDSSRLGLTLAIVALGSIAGAAWVLPWLRRRFATDNIPRIVFVFLALTFLGLAFIRLAPAFLLLCALSGASWAIVGSELWVAAQQAAANSIRGRANAILLMLSQGALALGAILLGALAAHFGTPAAFGLAAVALPVVAYVPDLFGLAILS
jgi:hypothetical protein